jgi:hypothetical protein
VSTSDEERPEKQEPSEGERPVQPMLLRVVGMFSLVVCGLAVYFAGVSEYLDESAVAAADHALVRGLRVVAGACAISGFAVGMFVLTRRDEGSLEAKENPRVHKDRTA